MAARKDQPLITGGFAWGNERVRLGVSIRRLSDLTGIPRGYLSMAERGRLVPTGEEYRKVMNALAQFEGSAA
jgi:transcriptional regulator with XRE-family HTH domain